MFIDGATPPWEFQPLACDLFESCHLGGDVKRKGFDMALISG